MKNLPMDKYATKTVPLVFKAKVPMDTQTRWGAFCGMAGGMVNYLAQIDAPAFLPKLVEAGITALICGILGAAGKHIYDILKLKIKTWRK